MKFKKLFQMIPFTLISTWGGVISATPSTVTVFVPVSYTHLNGGAGRRIIHFNRSTAVVVIVVKVSIRIRFFRNNLVNVCVQTVCNLSLIHICLYTAPGSQTSYRFSCYGRTGSGYHFAGCIWRPGTAHRFGCTRRIIHLCAWDTNPSDAVAVLCEEWGKVSRLRSFGNLFCFLCHRF